MFIGADHGLVLAQPSFCPTSVVISAYLSLFYVWDHKPASKIERVNTSSRLPGSKYVADAVSIVIYFL